MAKPTLGSLASLAFTKAAAKIGGVIHTATLRRPSTDIDNYDPAHGTMEAASEATDTGRVIVASDMPIPDVFPVYTPGPTDTVAYLIEFTTLAPQEGDFINFNDRKYQIRQVRDVMEAGELWAVVIR